MKSYDVVIVGAGPAGATAAKILAENNINVLLVDQSTFPRDKSCGGGLPTRVLQHFPYVKDIVDSSSYGSITHSSSLLYTFKILRDKPVIAMVLRKQFDHHLVKIAQKKGATVLEGKKVIDLKKEQEKLLITLEDNEVIKTKIVFGCEGMHSVVAEKTGLNTKNKCCICIDHEVKVDPEIIDTFFTKQKITHIFLKTQGIAGYGWIFPKKNSINIGLGEFESAIHSNRPKINLKTSYIEFIDMIKEKKFIPQDIQIDTLKGGTLPIYPLEKTYADGVLLCGDAAGFINPITGEGIYYAMISGELAAKTAIESIHKKDTSAQFLSQYQKQWKKEFGKDIKLLGKFTKLWGTDSERIIRILSNDPKFGKLLIGITGGQASISKYKLLVGLWYLYASVKDIIRGNPREK